MLQNLNGNRGGISDNVSTLGEVADFEAETFNQALNFNRMQKFNINPKARHFAKRVLAVRLFNLYSFLQLRLFCLNNHF